MMVTKISLFPVCMLLITVMAVTTLVQSAEEGVIDGNDRNHVTIFTAKSVHQDTFFEVVNVERKKKDATKHVTMNFTLKGSKLVTLKSVKHEDTQSNWLITLDDEKDLDIRVKALKNTHEMMVTWLGNRKIQDETREVCFGLGKDVKWFNTYQQFHQQWPIDLTRSLEKIPFNALQKETTSELQHIVEGTFLASNGFIIRFDGNSPLWYRIVPQTGSQEAQMCITAAGTAPYNTANKADSYQNIGFTLYAGADLREAYRVMSNNLLGSVGGIPKPQKKPEEHMFAFPIWEITAGRSAEFATTADLTTAKILEFRKKLKRHRMLHCVLLLDSWWQKTGQYLVVEDGERLHDLRHLAETLNPAEDEAETDYYLQLAISPYVSKETPFFKSNNAFLVQDAKNPGNPFVIRDGDRNDYGLLDFSNPDAADWFLKTLRTFQKDEKVASFLFEPVTITDMHTKYHGFEVNDAPGQYSHVYASQAAQLLSSSTKGSMASVKEARGSQDLSLFVHMSDRVSDWTDPRGLKSLIPTALALSMAGYSFIVPDLVGGRLPGPSGKLIPDPELYVRWAQATALMPAMQFATPPWDYNDTINDATVAAISLHTNTFKELIVSMANNRVDGDGTPIMRPMWWADPEDPKLYEAGVVDTQFLVGEEGAQQPQLLAAPILVQGAKERHVYLPSGKWFQQVGGVNAPGARVINGPLLIRASADLKHLLYFKRQI